MPIIKEGWADALEPGIREWFMLGANRRPLNIAEDFDVIPSNKSAEYFRGVGALSPDAWDHYRKNRTVPNVSFDQGYKTTLTNQTYVVELPVEYDLIQDNQYGEVIDAATQLGDSAMLKRATDAASIWNNAFSASFVGADAVALCSDSHPYSADKAGTTQDNNFALALTRANVRTLREAMMAFKDDAGNLVGVIPDTLRVPPALEDDALEISMSMLDPTSANNTMNPQFGRWKVKVDHYLTDTNAWFMEDSILRKRYLKWLERENLSIVLDRVEKRVMAVYNARMRYTYGWTHWTWIAGSNPS